MTINIMTIAFGTYRLSGNESEDIDIVSYAIRNGYSIIDTAESYKDGYSEHIVGKAIRGFDRKHITIVTKISPDMTGEEIMRRAKLSSVRLGTYIDIYLLHSENKKISYEETFGAFRELKKENLLLDFGMSNASYSTLVGLHKFGMAAVENEFSLCFRHNSDALRYCLHTEKEFLAYMPLSSGHLLAGNNLKRLKEFASRYGTSPANIALRWIIQKGGIPVIGSLDKAHILENTRNGFTISDEDMDELDSIEWEEMN